MVRRLQCVERSEDACRAGTVLYLHSLWTSCEACAGDDNVRALLTFGYVCRDLKEQSLSINYALARLRMDLQ